MLEPPPSRLLQTLRRLGTGPDATDAELLRRFVELKDETSFEELLRRHADLVMRVCRRHLGADADDAFQAVFLVLARDAGRIVRRESLAGWLYRVAHHVSRKLMGKSARRRTLPLHDADRTAADVAPEVDREELQAVVEAEINALPDRLRSAVVLCYIEGRTTAEAGALLGCPKGTIESRLASARKKLQARLSKRGVALVGSAALEPLLANTGDAAAPSLVRRTLSAVMQFARTGNAAGAVTDQVLALVAGVSSMTSYRLSLICAMALLLATLGGTGITVFSAKADNKPPDDTAKDADKGKPKPKPEAPPASPGKDEVRPATDNDSVMTMLKEPVGLEEPIQQIMFKEFIDLMQKRFKVPIRVDLATFTRLNIVGAVQLYERQVTLPVVRGMSLGDALRDALSQLELDGQGMRPLTFRVRNGQILVVPAYMPTLASVGGGAPGGGPEGGNLTAEQQLEQEEGEPITLSVEEKPFSEVLRELRQNTGANIVLDARAKDKAKMAVSASLHDVRLMAALRVLGDMCELQPVALNNVFYVTTKENAEKLQKEIDRRRYGAEQQGIGFGGLGGLGGIGGIGTPPATLGGLGGPGIQGGGGGGVAPTTPAPAPAKPKESKSGM